MDNVISMIEGRKAMLEMNVDDIIDELKDVEAKWEELKLLLEDKKQQIGSCTKAVKYLKETSQTERGG